MERSDVRPRPLHVDEQKSWRGGEQQMLYLARGLRERSFQTASVLQPSSPAVRRFRAAGVPVWETPMRGEIDIPAAGRIARLARKEGFNILHSHTAHAQSLNQLAAHLWGARCRVVAHRRIEYPVGRSLWGAGRLKYRLGVDAYIAISNRVKETLIEAGVPEWRVFVVRSVTNPERFLGVEPDPALREELGIPGDAFLVGNVAALVGHKDHRNLLEAARVVRERIPETWLVVVGEGPRREEIQARARSLHMADRLVLTGFRRDVPRLMKIFDVFALSSSEEGLCSTLLEAAAAGCPIVATDAGGVREAVLPGVTGIVVPVREPLALAEGILQLADNPRQARTLAERGRERVVGEFNPDVLAERTLEVYNRVLNGEVGAHRPVGFLQE